MLILSLAIVTHLLRSGEACATHTSGARPPTLRLEVSYRKGNDGLDTLHAVPDATLTGASISKYSEKELSRTLNDMARENGNLALGETQVRRMKFDEILAADLIGLIRRIRSNLFLIKYKEQVMVLRLTGPEGWALLAQVDQSEVPPPENGRFDFWLEDGSKTTSRTFTTANRLVIKGSDILDWMDEFMTDPGDPITTSEAKDKRREHPFLLLTHTHPRHEIICETELLSPETDKAVMHVDVVTVCPLGAADIAAAEYFSRTLSSVYFGISALTLNGHEYTAIFKDGKNVTADVAELLL